MILLSSIIKQFGPKFLTQYAGRILPSHIRALRVMRICRTRHSPHMLAQCDECQHSRLVPHSCGHRNCPHCQAHEGQQWLERQLRKRVPAEYFLITFTLPAEFRSLAWRYQRQFYSLMIQCGWDTLRTFSKNDPQLRGLPGAISVLHTHSRRLDFHPHVHWVIPAAAVDPKMNLWRTKNSPNGKVKIKKKNNTAAGYLFNHRALAKVFRAKMLEALTQAGLVLPKRHPEKWVVDVRSVGLGDSALLYLGRYLYRGVIQEKDIVACQAGKVTFRYREGKTDQIKFRTISGADFLWLVMQHVLPKGFRRARNFGFLHPNSKRLTVWIQFLLGLDPNRALAWSKQRPQWTCSRCGGKMNVIVTGFSPVGSYTPRLHSE